ncbi:hypothetical protein QBC39DRAFT_123862 [Podospora conica]|nr:hypothetical protein QBC39DRAFT_123862 [Schizothecium conicum]
MQFSFKEALLLALPLLASGAAVPVSTDAVIPLNETFAAGFEPRQFVRCRVNSRQRDLWVENGMSRWRTVFSAEKTDPAQYCDYWHRQGCGLNIQCGWDSQVDGGTWRVDASFVRGAGGDYAYWVCLDNTRRRWILDTECTTG